MSTTSLTDNYKGVWDSRIGFGNKAALIVIDFMRMRLEWKVKRSGRIP